MKRTALAGTFTLLAGAFALLLAASIFYSCRSGGAPHHIRSSASRPVPTIHEPPEEVETSSSLEKNPSLRRGLLSAADGTL